MSTHVSIIGAGLSKFGRQPGVTGRQLAVQAMHAALADAGIAWSDVRSRFGGSDGAGLADTLVAELGLTGIPFTNVRNGCATGGSALVVGSQRHPRPARPTSRSPSGSTSTRAARSTRAPRTGDCPPAYGETG